jgi:hypothetical protein
VEVIMARLDRSGPVLLVLAAAGCTGSIAGTAPAPAHEPRPGAGAGPGPAGAPPPAATAAAPGAGAAASPGPGTPPDGVPALPPADCGAPRPGRAPLRRLTRVEYDNTVRDLFGASLGGLRPASAFPPEEIVRGFRNNADALTASARLVEDYMGAAEQIAATVMANAAGRAALAGCDPAAGSDACARAFIRDVGKRAWRRPLAAPEIEDLFQLYGTGRARADAATGARLVLERLLQSPDFLYRVELGRPAAPGERVVPLTSWEMASRLSYLLLGSMPDPELLRAAEAGELATPQAIGAQARRLLATPQARAMVKGFFAQWLGLEQVDAIDKDRTVFPKFRPTLPRLFRMETETLLDAVMWQGSGSLAELLTAPYTYADATLAAFYGLTGPTGTAFARVELDPTKRAGMLTHAGLLAALAETTETNPVLRGKFVREHLLCGVLPDPPGDVPPFPPPRPGLSMRARLGEHSANPACAGCHKLLDPLGLGMEDFDGVGLHRALENGKPVDASGAIYLPGSNGAEGRRPFAGAAELGRKLAAEAAVSACAVEQWFHFGYGRLKSAEDACTVAHLERALAGAKLDLRALVIALTQTDAFLYRPASEGRSP